MSFMEWKNNKKGISLVACTAEHGYNLVFYYLASTFLIGLTKVDENQAKLWCSNYSSFIQVDNEPLYSAISILRKFYEDYIVKLEDDMAFNVGKIIYISN